MAAPTVTSITPPEGLTRGETFVTILGTGFIPPTPVLASEAPTGPFTRVFFDNVEALEVGVVNSTKILCLTPRSTLKDPAQVDVRVENVTPPGPLIEPVTVVDGFEYRRPSIATPRDHSTDEGVLVVTRHVVDELRRHVLENTTHDQHPEYVDALSAAAAEEVQAKTPSLKVLGPAVAEDRFYAINGEFNVQTAPNPGGTFDRFSNPVTLQLSYQYVGVARSTGEVSQLFVALTDYFGRTPRLEVPLDGNDKANGVTSFEWSVVWEERAEFRSQATRQAVYQFEGTILVRGVHVAVSKVLEGVDVADGVTLVVDLIP